MSEDLEKSEATTSKKTKSRSIDTEQKLVLRNSSSKLNLRTKTGKKVLWTLDEALMPHNLKQLSETLQKGLVNGKSASQILQEIDASK